MINTLILQARLIETPELKETKSGSTLTNVRLAWNEKIKDDKEHKFFVTGVAWGHKAEFLCKYFKKGDMVVVSGKLVTRTYEKDEETKYLIELMIESIHFCGNKKDSQNQEYEDTNSQNKSNTYTPTAYAQGKFDMEKTVEEDNDLPF